MPPNPFAIMTFDDLAQYIADRFGEAEPLWGDVCRAAGEPIADLSNLLNRKTAPQQMRTLLETLAGQVTS